MRSCASLLSSYSLQKQALITRTLRQLKSGSSAAVFLPPSVSSASGAANRLSTRMQAKQEVFEGKDGHIVIGGHRGVGENLSGGRDSVFPAFRENTIKSFQRAAELGVTFVEFDVQVTRDGVPVLWHDDDVIYGDVADPKTCLVKDLTLAQFQELCATSSSSSASSSPPSSPLSSSMQAPGSPRRSKLLRKFRDKTTHQWNDGLRPWDCTMDDGLPTLEAVFNSVPESVGFDIEVKMTTPDDLVHTPQEEIDRMLSAILRVVNDCSSRSEASRKRKIFFSSFDPDICTDLKRRKAPYPIYYLSGCGLYQHADARRTSIPAALDFATSNELGGVVLPASILIANKGMVQDARARELALMTYGLENNDLSAVEEQGRLGVHAAIIDDVEAALAHPGTPRVHVTADGTPADAGAKI